MLVAWLKATHNLLVCSPCLYQCCFAFNCCCRGASLFLGLLATLTPDSINLPLLTAALPYVFNCCCCCRGAPLSQGWLATVTPDAEEDASTPPSSSSSNGHTCVVCPYHGWAFDGQGKLQDVPSAEPGRWPKRSLVSAYPVRKKISLLSTCLVEGCVAGVLVVRSSCLGCCQPHCSHCHPLPGAPPAAAAAEG
jgi:hypothetical protein